MNRISTIFSVSSLVGVVVLFILYFCSIGGKTEEVTDQNPVKTGGTRIVYVNADSLLSDKFLLYKKLSEEYLKIQEGRITDLNIKAKELDQDAQEWQRKMQNNGFITEDRAVAAREKILDKQRELQRLQQETSELSMKEEAEMTEKVFGEVTAFLKEYNADKKFDVVFSTNIPGNVLYAEKGFDITDIVLDGLNKRFLNNK